MKKINSCIAIEVFNIKTGKIELLPVELDCFIDWFNRLEEEDIKQLSLSKKGYKRVKSLIQSGEIAKTYNQNVYDFAFAYIQFPTLNLVKLTFAL